MIGGRRKKEYVIDITCVVAKYIKKSITVLYQTDESYIEDNQQKELYSKKFDATAPSWVHYDCIFLIIL